MKRSNRHEATPSWRRMHNEAHPNWREVLAESMPTKAEINRELERLIKERRNEGINF